MSSMEKPSTPASINMTAGSGEELSSMIKAIATLAGTAKGGEEVVTGTPTASDSMRSVIDKLNPMDDQPEEKVDEILPALASGGAAVGRAAMSGLRTAGKMFGSDDEQKEAYDNTPMDPTDSNEFDAEQHAHHENPAGAARGRGNMNNPRANTMEQIEQNLFAEYEKFISESEQLATVGKNPRSVDVQAVYEIISQFDQNMSEIYAYGDPDYKAAIAALQQGDVETAVGAVVDTYGTQNGGEVRNMDVYAKDLQDEFEYLVQGGG
jgi:hypothetical protein